MANKIYFEDFKVQKLWYPDHKVNNTCCVCGGRCVVLQKWQFKKIEMNLRFILAIRFTEYALPP